MPGTLESQQIIRDPTPAIAGQGSGLSNVVGAAAQRQELREGFFGAGSRGCFHEITGKLHTFHALTWHRSLENKTARPRRSFIVSYQDALAVRGNGEQHKILRPA